MTATFIIHSGKRKGMRLRLTSNKVVIGRDERCAIRLNSTDVSRKHCLVALKGDVCRVKDLGSRNGTFVNDEQIEGEVTLKEGDHLRVGPMEFVLNTDTGTKKPPEPATTDDDIASWLNQDYDEYGSSGNTTIMMPRYDPDAAAPEAEVAAETPQPVADDSEARSSSVAEEAADIIRRHLEKIGQPPTNLGLIEFVSVGTSLQTPRKQPRVRIVAGKLRRRKIESLGGLNTRPITDRVKEVLFENMGGELQGERVADVFAGTGTIGLEALSRGAHSVVFIENDPRAHAILKSNVEKLGVTHETLCWRTDVLRTSFRPQNVPDFLPFDLVFFDPPYKMVDGIQTGSRLYKSLQRLARDDVSAPTAQLVFRAPKHAEYEMPEDWQPSWDLLVAGMQIQVYRKSVSEPLPPAVTSPPPDAPEDS